MKDYQKSITISNSPQEIYAALTEHIQDWWSDDYSGAAAKKGDQYQIAFGATRKTFEITRADPDQQVAWLCLEAFIDLETLNRKDEWVGTRMIWTIIGGQDNTTLTFLHEGLNQGFECYQVCAAGWDYFMGSLHAFLTTGKGTPFLKQEARLGWE